jgi:hypothetical protein
VEKIKDKTGMKGTGKWTVSDSANLAQPVTLIAEAVFSRCVSAMKDERVKASRKLKRGKPVTGLVPVQASVSFKITAPAKLAGLDRSNVVLMGKGKKAAVAVTYGTGMNSIAVIQRPVEGKKKPKDGSGFELPTKQIAGLTVTELGTPLGAVAEFERSGVAYTVIGSVPLSNLESALAGL